jgi:chromosome segregation and condensation protein ScpB
MKKSISAREERVIEYIEKAKDIKIRIDKLEKKVAECDAEIEAFILLNNPDREERDNGGYTLKTTAGNHKIAYVQTMKKFYDEVQLRADRPKLAQSYDIAKAAYDQAKEGYIGYNAIKPSLKYD